MQQQYDRFKDAPWFPEREELGDRKANIKYFPFSKSWF